MAYRVSLTRPAEDDAYVAFERIRVTAPAHAERWLVRLLLAIQTLEEFPNRCPLVPEAKWLGFPAQQLIFGKGRGAFRIIFHVREDQQHVRVLRIWHGYRGAITIEDVEEA